MSLTDKLMRIRDALTPLTDHVYHYWRTNLKPPYLLWAEDAEESSFNANTAKAEQQIHGTADYFTKLEFDPVIDAIQDALENVTHAGWRLSSAQYEEETGLIHYTWDWWVV